MPCKKSFTDKNLAHNHGLERRAAPIGTGINNLGETRTTLEESVEYEGVHLKGLIFKFSWTSIQNP